MPNAIRIPSLRMQDIDGAPDVQGVERIYLTDGHLSDMGNASVLLSLSGDGLSHLTIRDIDGIPSIANLSTLYVTNGFLSDLGNSNALLSMSGSASSGITVQEIDGSPLVNNVTTIQVSNGTLTDNGGGNVTVTTGGSGSTPNLTNIAINGGFDYFQQQVPGTATSRTDDTYGPDCWNILTQTAAINCNRTTGDTTSVNAVRLTQTQAAAQRFGIEHIVEAINSKPLRSKTVIAQARINISNAQDVRIALLEHTGTADTPTSDVVNDWTSTTYTAGNFFIGTDLTVVAVAEVSPSAATWTAISVSGAVSASCDNLIMFIWTEGTAAQNVTLDVTEAGIYVASSVQAWVPELSGSEYARVTRLVWGMQSDGTATNIQVGFGTGVSTTVAQILVVFPTQMRVAPTLTATATEWQVSSTAASTDMTAITIGGGVATAVGLNSVAVLCTVAAGLTQFRPYFLQSDGSAGRVIFFSAQL